MVLTLVAPCQDFNYDYYEGLFSIFSVFVLWLGLCFRGCSLMSSPTSGTYSENWVLDRRWQRFAESFVIEVEVFGEILCI